MDAVTKRLTEGFSELVAGITQVVARELYEGGKFFLSHDGEIILSEKTKGGRPILPGQSRLGVDMVCRVPRCKNRSRGPRFRYLCKEHRHVGKKKAREYIARFNALADMGAEK